MSRNAPKMISLARRYCELIEASNGEDVSWLKDVADLLPRLHAAVNSFNGRAYDGAFALAPDLDARFELYSHLVDLLGDRDSYWLEFDRADDSHAMTGSLADDLTDIYCELKHGLRTVDQDPEQSLRAWWEGFARHWGQHLADAERHLSALTSQGRLER
ncbi:MAG: DUF5063 domain-containing protein [Chromatiaceae bacterium]|jgi:hypothetical protein|nr:DUF5063 domain-containing protein [Chromatiaceae bacterium]